MRIFLHLMGFCMLILPIFTQALEKTKFVFNETDPNKGSLIVPELIINGATAFQDVELELNFNTATFNLKNIRSTDSQFIIPSVEITNQGFKVVDSWILSGGRDQSSLRNHHYIFDVTSVGAVTISIESSVDNYLYLKNELGFIVSQSDGNTVTETLSPGTYTVVAATFASF